LNKFLSRSLRNSIHFKYQTKIIRKIVEGENNETKISLAKFLEESSPLIIDNKTKCSQCDNEIYDENFIITSEGSIIHFKCYIKNNK